MTASMEGFGTIALRADNPKIARVEDTTSPTGDPPFKRMRVYFTNGWSASIIRGPGTYGGNEGLFEVMAIDPGGAFLADEVLGWLKESEVMQVIDVLANFEPEQLAVTSAS